MIDLQNKNYGFRYFGLIAILLLHNLDTCTSVGPYFDKRLLEQGDLHPTPEATAEQTKHVVVTVTPHATAATNLPPDASDSSPPNDNRRESQMPPILFPTNSPNSSSSVRIVPVTIDISDRFNISAQFKSMLNNRSVTLEYPPKPNASAGIPSANVSSDKNTTVPGAETYDMTHGKKYDGQYDVDDIKSIAKKYNHTKEMKNVTKPAVVVDSKKDSKIDSNKNGTKSPTPEVNNKTATVEGVSKAEAKPLPDSKNKTSVIGKTEEVHKGEATLIVPPSPQHEILGKQKSTSTLREVGKTLAAILVTIVGTASMLFVGFLMWRRISRRYYGHREMLINEDDFEEVSDLHHFEGTTDTPPSQSIISQR